MPTATGVCAGTFGATAPKPRGDVLYDQYDNAGPYSTRSQNYEPFLDIYDAELADDFVVPAGVRWDIDGVDVQGVNGCGPGPVRSVNVRFYADAAGIPGALVSARVELPFTGEANFVVELEPAVRVRPGRSWVSVQANEDFVTAGQWGWTDRLVQSNEGAAWENPGGGFGVCPSWGGRATTCAIDVDAPDQVYRLRGTSHSPHMCTPGCPASAAGDRSRARPRDS
jgi:hypothetical protein